MTDQPEPWTASISALGPITKKTPFTVDAIARLLPDYEIEDVGAPPEAPDNPIIAARVKGAEGRTAIEFIGHKGVDTVVSARVFEAGRIPNAFMIGSSLSETLLRPDRCLRSGGLFRDYVTCDMQDEPWLLYWITSDEIAAHGPGEVPPPDTLARGVISFISWIPWHDPDEPAT